MYEVNDPNNYLKWDKLFAMIPSEKAIAHKRDRLCCLWINLIAQKATIHQVTTKLATSKNVLFPRHNHLLTTGADDPSLFCI